MKYLFILSQLARCCCCSSDRAAALHRFILFHAEKKPRSAMGMMYSVDKKNNGKMMIQGLDQTLQLSRCKKTAKAEEMMRQSVSGFTR